MDSISVELKTNDAPVEASVHKETLGLQGFLGVSTPSDEDTKQLQSIVDYLKSEDKELTELDLLAKVRNLESRMGTPRLGESRLARLYHYAKIQSQISGLEKERNELLR